ncbi:MAG TPA: papain-like cysteine protease family protein, partial [Chitinophaga sp.]
FFQNSVIDKNLWDAYAAILGYNDTLDMLDYYFKGRLISEWDDIYYNDIAPVVFDRIVDAIKLENIATDMTSASRYKGGERVMRINFNGTTSKTRADFNDTMLMSCSSPVVKNLKNLVTLTVENVRIGYSTAHFNGLLFSGSIGDDILDDTSLYIPENADEKKDPRKEDRFLAQKLIDHLNSNLEHYNKALWYNLDADRRFMLLDGFNIQIFNGFGVPVGFRSLASVVKNQLISIVGNSLVLPVAPGYKVSQSFITEETDEGVEQEVTLLDHYQPLTPVPPYRISVPTRGVFMEAVQGACDACEKVKENSSQDWTKFGTEEPSPISAITPPTPTARDWQSSFKDFATALVAMQTAPATPDVAAGLAGLSTLLAKNDSFKDLTGLEKNLESAMKAYTSNQENAKAFAEMAKGMAMQSHNTDNSSKIMDTLKNAKDSGAISNEDYGKLVKEHLQQQIDGGATKQAELEKEKTPQKPTLTDAAVKAADQGKDVKAQKTDAEGNVESVEIRGNGRGAVLAEVEGIIPILRQDKTKGCWATAATMMVSWKMKETLSVLSILELAGNEYVQKYNANTGLKASEKQAFISKLGMVGEWPGNYLPQQYIDWVKDYGPLWITTDSSLMEGPFSPHARILTGIEGTGLPNGTYFTFINPAYGTEETESYLDFVAAFQQMVTDNESDKLFVQIVHFKDKYEEDAEGYQVEGPWNAHIPLHENLTLAALSNSSVGAPADVKPGNDKASNEFLRGVIWNDDPAVLMFNDQKDGNWNFSSGTQFVDAFFTAKEARIIDLRNLTGRSHFFDMQFLHAMASKVGEDPRETQAKMLMWVESMYKLSIGEGILDTDTLESVPVSTKFGNTTYSFDYFFDDTITNPRETATFKTLLSRDSICLYLVGHTRRAIGSVLHIVQDSFARGHVKRKLKNPGDLKPGTTDQFLPGKYGDFGEIERFRTYKGQDQGQHDQYDVFDLSQLNINKLETYNGLWGARNAIDYSIKVLDFWKKRTPYANGPKALFENEIFKLASNAAPADTGI